MLDLSIIILSYNTEKLLTECLDSIYKLTKGITFEVIVVDNASSDNSLEQIEKLAKKYQTIDLIANNKNLGFAKANNLAIKRAKGRYLLLLNSDTLIKVNMLPEILYWMDGHPKVGIASCALKNADGSLQPTGGYFPTLFKIFSWMFFLDDLPLIDRLVKPYHPLHEESFFYQGKGLFKKVVERDWVTGAFFLVRREVVEKVGFLDENYFMYVEEVDFCFRAKKTGWQVWFLPEWSIIHIGRASSSDNSFPIISEYQGLKVFYKKHMPHWQYNFLRLFLKIGSIFRILLFILLGKFKRSRIYVQAIKAI